MNAISFSISECEKIISYFDINKSVEGSLSTLTDSDGNTQQFRKGNHNNKITNLTNSELDSLLIEKFKHLGVKNIGLARVVRYLPGEYMGPHTDFYRYGDKGSIKTIIVQLSDENSYSGGDLIVNDKVQSRAQGSVIVISSTQVHEVTEVKSGIRYNLAAFLWEDDIEIVKSAI